MLEGSFSISDGVLKSYTGPGGAVSVPDGVVKVATGAFRNTTVTELRFPESLKHILPEGIAHCRTLRKAVLPDHAVLGREAFADCTALEEVTLPGDLRQIAEGLFHGCGSLREIQLPETVEGIGVGAFSGSGLQRVALPSGVRIIRSGAFSGAPLTDVSMSVCIPDMRLEEDAFSDCPVERLTLTGEFETEVVWGTEQAERLFWWPLAPLLLRCSILRAPQIPPAGLPADVQMMLFRGFADAELSGETYPDKIRKEYLRWFRKNRDALWEQPQILKVLLREHIILGAERGRFLEQAKRMEDSELTEILTEGRTQTQSGPVRADSVGWEMEPISDGACRLTLYKGTDTEVQVPEQIKGRKVSTLGSNLFSPQAAGVTESRRRQLESIRSVRLPDTLIRIEEGAFYGCTGLEEVRIPDSVQDIEAHCFQGCSRLKELILPDGLLWLGESCFQDCGSLEEADLPDGVDYIPAGAFQGCTSLKAISVSDRLESVGASAFRGCTALVSVWFPDTLTEIQDSAFEDCASLEEIILEGERVDVGRSIFRGCAGLRKVTLPGNMDFEDLEALMAVCPHAKFQAPKRSPVWQYLRYMMM